MEQISAELKQDLDTNWPLWLAIGDCCPTHIRIAIANSACKAVGLEDAVSLFDDSRHQVTVQVQKDPRITGVRQWLWRNGQEHSYELPDSPYTPALLVANVLIDILHPDHIYSLIESTSAASPLFFLTLLARDTLLENSSNFQGHLALLKERTTTSAYCIAVTKLITLALLQDKVKSAELLALQLADVDIEKISWAESLVKASLLSIEHFAELQFDLSKLSNEWYLPRADVVDFEAFATEVDRLSFTGQSIVTLQQKDSRKIVLHESSSSASVYTGTAQAAGSFLKGKFDKIFYQTSVVRAEAYRGGIFSSANSAHAMGGVGLIRAGETIEAFREFVRSENEELTKTWHRHLSDKTNLPQAVAESFKTATVIEKRTPKRLLALISMIAGLVENVEPDEELREVVFTVVFDVIKSPYHSQSNTFNAGGIALQILKGMLKRHRWDTDSKSLPILRIMLNLLQDPRLWLSSKQSALEVIAELLRAEANIESVDEELVQVTLRVLKTSGEGSHLNTIVFEILCSEQVLQCSKENGKLSDLLLAAVEPYIYKETWVAKRILKELSPSKYEEVFATEQAQDEAMRFLSEASLRSTSSGADLTMALNLSESFTEATWEKLSSVWKDLLVIKEGMTANLSLYSIADTTWWAARPFLETNNTRQHLNQKVKSTLIELQPLTQTIVEEAQENTSLLASFSIPRNPKPNPQITQLVVLMNLAVGYLKSEETFERAKVSTQELAEKIPDLKKEITSSLHDFCHLIGHPIDVDDGSQLSRESFYASMPTLLLKIAKTKEQSSLQSLVGSVLSWGPEKEDLGAWTLAMSLDLSIGFVAKHKQEIRLYWRRLSQIGSLDGGEWVNVIKPMVWELEKASEDTQEKGEDE